MAGWKQYDVKISIGRLPLEESITSPFGGFIFSQKNSQKIAQKGAKKKQKRSKK